MFHRKFPNINISATTIERIYFQSGIRFKFINKLKKLIDYSNEYYLNLFMEMHSKLKEVNE